jgi:signal transduction histidine kinase
MIAKDAQGFHRNSDRGRHWVKEDSDLGRLDPHKVGGLKTYVSSVTREHDLAIVLRAMEHRLVNLIDERARLARDLHDGLLQSLYAIGLGIETASRSGCPTAPLFGQTREFIVDQLNRAIADVRSLVRSLESESVQEFDLRAELDTLVETYMHIGPARITANIAPQFASSMTLQEKQEILMIIREALSNSVRHARATHIALSLQLRKRSIRLLVQDDGVGFPHEERKSRGYGLSNMAARVKKLGGRLLIRSSAGKGTSVVVDLSPVPEYSNS